MRIGSVGETMNTNNRKVVDSEPTQYNGNPDFSKSSSIEDRVDLGRMSPTAPTNPVALPSNSMCHGKATAPLCSTAHELLDVGTTTDTEVKNDITSQETPRKRREVLHITRPLLSQHRREKNEADTAAMQIHSKRSSNALQKELPAHALQSLNRLSTTSSKVPRRRLRCDSCKCKLSVLPIVCRCGGAFCSLHRLAERHSCTFDYKTLGKRKIEDENPVILAPKVLKIN